MNIPGPFLSMLESVLSKDEIAVFLEALASPASTTIRYNPQKKPLQMNGEPLPWSMYGRRLSERPFFTHDPLFHAGAYYVQDASSQILEHVLKQHVDFGNPLRLLDLCAAPGGKTTHLLSLLSNDSLLVTNEVIAKRSHILKENVIKWGYPNVVITQKEAWQFTPLSGYFDIVVVDAPCSGEGLFRKDPSAVEEWSPELVELSAQRQRKILADIWGTVRPGGHLVYSTCTYNKKENEENVEWLRDTLDAEILPISVPSDWKLHISSVGSGNALRFFPHDEGGEGFFVAILQKKTNTESVVKKHKIHSHRKEYTDKEIQHWVQESSSYCFYERGDEIIAFPASRQSDLALLTQLSPLYTGVAIAQKKGKVLVPHHALAVSSICNTDQWQHIQVSLEEALAYLKKDVVRVPGDDGYALIYYGDIPLGWIKIIGHRNNNLYPIEWRIRK